MNLDTNPDPAFLWDVNLDTNLDTAFLGDVNLDKNPDPAFLGDVNWDRNPDPAFWGKLIRIRIRMIGKTKFVQRSRWTIKIFLLIFNSTL